MRSFARTIAAGYRELARRVYTRRYGTLARHLGRDETPAADEAPLERGFIVVQIDGLAYDHLVQAMALGAAPYIKRLIGAGRLRLAAWRCGLPSTTPAVQAGIMFGNNWDIPGFRWYDKAQRRAIVYKLPQAAQTTQVQVAAGRPGILTGGSSYYNMFDGGAEWSVFTMSAIRAPNFFGGVRGLGFALMFLLNPLRVLRIIRLSVWNYCKAASRRVLALFRPSVYRPFDFLSPMAQVLTQVLFQEIITFGVQMDIYRGARAIYLNNVSYDEVAHQLGPTHPAAFETLKGVDHQIAQIDKMATRYRERQYDLYILSDHGMSPSIPFQQRFGLSLGDLILQQIDQPLLLEERWDAARHSVLQAQYLLDELRGLEQRLSPRSATVARAARRYLAQQLPDAQITEPLLSCTDSSGEEVEPGYSWDPERHSDVAVRLSGPLAHVYFNVSDERLNLSDIALLYPELLTRLVEHPGIGLVAGREGGETVMMSRDGTWTMNQVRAGVSGPGPLAGLGDPFYQAAQIDHLASFPHSGDLILFGAWGDGNVVSFEEQLGTHGGLGGPQGKPFILYPDHIELPERAIGSARELYPLFARYLDGTGRATAAAPRQPAVDPVQVAPRLD